MKIVITCDDFGESAEGDRRIIQAFRKKLIDRTSLLVDGKATPDAVRVARRLHIPVGLHFFCGETVSENVMRTLSHGTLLRELTRQWQAIEPLKPTHFDSHLHTHLLPWVAPIVAETIRVPIRGAKQTIGPMKGKLIGVFARRFPTVDCLIDLDWFPKLSGTLVRSLFAKISREATVEVILHPQRGKSLDWILAHDPLHRYSHI